MSYSFLECKAYSLAQKSLMLKFLGNHIVFEFGYDCDGTPVQAGDWVETTEAGLLALGRLDDRHQVGEIFLVEGIYRYAYDGKNELVASLESLNSSTWNTQLSLYRKVDEDDSKLLPFFAVF